MKSLKCVQTRTHLRVLESGGAGALGDVEGEASAGRVGLDGGGVDLVGTIGRAGKEVVVLELEGRAGKGEAGGLGAGAGVGGVGDGEAESTGGVDVDLLAARDLGVKGEGAGTADEEGVSLAGVGDAVGSVDGRVLVQPEVGAVGVDGLVLDVRARVDGDSAKGRGGSSGGAAGLVGSAGGGGPGHGAGGLGGQSDGESDLLVVGAVLSSLSARSAGTLLSIIGGRGEGDGVAADGAIAGSEAALETNLGVGGAEDGSAHIIAAGDGVCNLVARGDLGSVDVGAGTSGGSDGGGCKRRESNGQGRENGGGLHFERSCWFLRR